MWFRAKATAGPTSGATLAPVVAGNRLALSVFLAGAIASAVWAFFNLRPLAQMFGSGGGGIGGFSDSVDALKYVLAPLIAFAISGRVRAREGLAQRLRTAHMATTATIIMLIALFVLATSLGNFTHGIDRLWFALLVAAFVGGALWLPVQSFFAAGFLGLLIKERGPTS
jgi:hypothetical protein